MNAQFVFSDQHAVPILVASETLGTSTTIKLCGHHGRIVLPRVLRDGIDPQKHGPLAVPEGFARGVLPQIHSGLEAKDWGYESSRPSGNTYVSRFLLEFALSEDYDLAGDQLFQIERSLQNWFRVLRDWIEVLTGQDLNTSEPLTQSRATPAGPMWSWRSGKTWKSMGGSGGKIFVVVPGDDPDYVVSLTRWAYAVDQANHLTGPSASRMLLRDAKANNWRERHQLATIYAAMAAETAIKRTLKSILSNQGQAPTQIDRELRRTLGQIAASALGFGINLPSDFKSKLVDPRNDAVHHNTVPSNHEAREAIRVARQVLNTLEPLPI